MYRFRRNKKYESNHQIIYQLGTPLKQGCSEAKAALTSKFACFSLTINRGKFPTPGKTLKSVQIFFRKATAKSTVEWQLHMWNHPSPSPWQRYV